MNSNEINERLKFYNNGYLKINLSKNKSYIEIMHAAAPNKSQNGSFRLIYNLCLESQINTFSTGTGIAEKFISF